MTGLWLEYLFGDEKAIQMLPPKDAEQAQSTMGPWNGCTWGTAYCKLDWQGELSAFPSTRASEGPKGKHNALGLRPGNCLNMRAWNCSSIKRIRTWNENIAGMGVCNSPKHKRRNGGSCWSHTPGLDLGPSCSSWTATHFLPPFPRSLLHTTPEQKGRCCSPRYSAWTPVNQSFF